MKKKPRKTKLPRWVEKVVRIHVPASLPPEFFNVFAAAIARARACGEISAEAEEACFSEFELQAEKYHMMRDRSGMEKPSWLCFSTTAYRKTPPAPAGTLRPRDGGSPVRWRLISFLGLVAQMMRRPSLSAGSARLLMRSW